MEMCLIIMSMSALQSYLRSLVEHMSTSTSFLKVWTLNLYLSYFKHTVFTCVSLGFLQAYALYPDKDSDLHLKKFSTFLLPIRFLNRFSVPLGMQGWTEERYFVALQTDQPTFWLHHTRSNETFSMELANFRLRNPNANHSLWLGRSHTKVRIWIYFEMKTYSKLLHELDFVLRKLSHASSKWFRCEQCICSPKLCVHECSLQHWW